MAYWLAGSDSREVRTVRDESVVVDLVIRARDGDETAWSELVFRYAPLVWSICRQFRLTDAECDDIGQTVWLGLVESLSKLREPAALPGWLVTTTRRECLRVQDFRRRRPTHELRELDISDPGSIDDRYARTELESAMREAFAQLGPPCQQLLVLLMQSPPVPYAEITARLGMPPGSIGPTRARCLARLRRSPALAAWIEADGGGA